jgi:hypothetical protein
MFLDLAFEQLVKTKVGTRDGANILTPELLNGVRTYFETMKESFNPKDDDEADISVPFPGVPDLPGVGIQNGYLKLKR